MAESTFRVGGLASGMDTNSIIDKLVALEQRPIATYQSRQAAIKVNISDLGSLSSRLDLLAGAAKTIGKSAAATIVPTKSSYDDFAISGKPTYAGRYNVRVETLAQSAKMRFTGELDSPDSIVNSSGVAKPLTFMLDGTTEYSIDVDDGMTIAQVAARINAGTNGVASPVTASIVSNGSKYFMTVTRKDTGYASVDAADGLKLKVDPDTLADLDGGLGAYSKTDATNAKIHVDDLVVSSRTNVINNVIPGATLTLKAARNTDTDVVLEQNTSGASANLKSFVDAFNSVASFLRDNLRPSADSKVGTRQNGATMVSLQLNLQRLVSTQTTTTGSIRTINDLGVSIDKTGGLVLNEEKLTAAIAKDPAAVDNVFGRTTTGMSDVVGKLVKAQTNGIDGALFVRKKSLQSEITRLDTSIAKTTSHVEAFKARLIKQFTAMENLLGSYQSISNYLGQQTTQQANKT